jgi:hypothetical protein
MLTIGALVGGGVLNSYTKKIKAEAEAKAAVKPE